MPLFFRRRARRMLLLAAAWVSVGCASLAPDTRQDQPAPASDSSSALHASALPADAGTDASGPPVRMGSDIGRQAAPPPSSAPDLRAPVPAPVPAPTPAQDTGPTGGSAQAAPGDVPASSTAAPGRDVWTRIRSGFAMPGLDSPLVAQRVRWYLARPDLLAQMLERGAPYLHFILEAIEARGMPTELALLPFVESAMNPIALSHASASGLWQFIPATGKRFELSQDWWVDERRDIVESTRAALEYLQEVHDMHGNDWFLALASYNWGENAVARAVRGNLARGRPAGYPDLRMPQETRHYVPKLLALKRIVLQAAELGIVLPHIPDTPYFTTVQHTRPLDMKLAAQFAGMSLDDFTLLNPAHNRPVIATHRHDGIKLPVDRVAAFRQAAAHHEAQRMPFVTWRPHTLAPGEDLNAIAARHDMTPTDILRANGLPGQSSPRPGSRILVPTKQAGDPAALEAFDRPSLILPEARQRIQRSTARRGGRTASVPPPRSSTAVRNAPAGVKAASRQPDKAKASGAKLTRTAAKAPPAQTRRTTAGPRSGSRR